MYCNSIITDSSECQEIGYIGMNIDIKENYIYQLDSKLLAILRMDKSSGKNIIWATDNYAERGLVYKQVEFISLIKTDG